MKKTELVHVHNLLGTIAKELHEDDVVTETDLDEYRALGTSPMTIRGSRDDHERATLTLAGALARAIRRDSGVERDADTDTVEPDADSRKATV